MAFHRSEGAGSAAGATADPRQAVTRLAGGAQLVENAVLERMTPGLQTFGDQNAAAGKARERFSRATRYQREQAILFDGSSPLLRKLAERHEIQLKRLDAGQPELLWQSRGAQTQLSTEQVQALLPPAPRSFSRNRSPRK